MKRDTIEEGVITSSLIHILSLFHLPLGLFFQEHFEIVSACLPTQTISPRHLQTSNARNNRTFFFFSTEVVFFKARRLFWLKKLIQKSIPRWWWCAGNFTAWSLCISFVLSDFPLKVIKHWLAFFCKWTCAHRSPRFPFYGILWRFSAHRSILKGG